jgi:hypothetical protein
MKLWHFIARCYDGNHGWGTTGQITLITVTAKLKDDGLKAAEKMIPGGWKIWTHIELPQSPGILHLYIPHEKDQ